MSSMDIRNHLDVQSIVMSYGYLKRYTQRDKHKSSKPNDLCILHIAWILGIDGDFTLGQPKDCPSIAYDHEPRTHREKTQKKSVQ